MTDALTRASIALLMVPTALNVACARRSSNDDALHATGSFAAQSHPGDLAGDWLLLADPPLPPDGLRVTVTIDSVPSASLFGRISHYFSGDVGTDPREFGPLVGVLKAGGDVEFTVERRDATLRGMLVVGRIAGDTLHCQRLVLGPDTLTGGSRSWLFVRRSL